MRSFIRDTWNDCWPILAAVGLVVVVLVVAGLIGGCAQHVPYHADQHDTERYEINRLWLEVNKLQNRIGDIEVGRNSPAEGYEATAGDMR